MLSGIVTWLIVFGIICGCIFLWTYVIHKRSESMEDDPDCNTCDGDCLSCAAAFNVRAKSESGAGGRE